MSAPAYESMAKTLSPLAESSAAVDAAPEAAGVDDTVAADAPRRGSRTRKPTSRAAGLDPTEAATASPGTQQKDTRSRRKRKADDIGAEQEDVAETELGTVFEKSASDGEDDEDEKQYCICRGNDDGTFMISCERCQDWFHTKCIGITQKAAKKLDEYVCEACRNKTGATQQKATSSKPIKRYKSSRGQHRSRSAKLGAAGSDSEHDEKQDNASEEDSASDDEYINEAGDDASNHEDAAMQDNERSGLPARPHPRKQSEPSVSASKAKAVASGSGSADKASQRRASESLRRASGSSKPATTLKRDVGRKPTGPTDAGTEEARSRARKVLAAALEKIFVGAATKGKSSADIDEEEESDEQRAQTFAALLEGEIFESNADVHGSIRVVGSKYKDRFRTFLFSLKDAKNTTLHSRIASGELQASELAKMSNEELANDSIRQATEKARLEALHRSTLRSEDAGPLRKMTHKGEVEIESDSVIARDQPLKLDGRSAAKQNDRSFQAPAARVSENEPAVHVSHKDGEDDEEAMAPSSPKDDPARRSAPVPDLAHASPSRLNFGDVWTRSEDAPRNDQDDEAQESFGFGVGSPHDEGYDQNVAVDEVHDTVVGGADDFIDSFLDGADDERNEAAQSATVAERSTTPTAEPPSSAVHRYRGIIWNGLIDLPDVFAFQGHVKQVAGRSLNSATRVWSKFFPERPLLVAGRLPTKAGTDYLLQVVNASRTEILAFTMEPGVVKDGAVHPQESDLASFEGMLHHFKDADRWGALHISSSVKGSLIKDFYVVPLHKDDEVPLWLDMAESDALGAEWHTKRDRDLLMLVAVVIRDALHAELSKAGRSPNRDRSATNEGQRQHKNETEAAAEEAYDPSAGLSVALGHSGGGQAVAVSAAAQAASAAFGSDALQSLLRTLGKSTAPPASGSAPAALPGALSPLAGVQAGPPPPGPHPGPPPGPPPAFPGRPPPANQSPMAGSWSPYAAAGAEGNAATPPQHWQQQQPPYAAYAHTYAPAAGPAAYGNGGGWGQEQGWQQQQQHYDSAPPQHQELPEEEYPGQYNPDFLAQGGARGGPRHGQGQARGRGVRGRDGGW